MITVDYPIDRCPCNRDIVTYRVPYCDWLDMDLFHHLEDYTDILYVVMCKDGMFIVTCESDPICIPSIEINWRDPSNE